MEAGSNNNPTEAQPGSLRSQLVTGVAVLLLVSLVTITAVVGLWIEFIGTSAELLVFLAVTLLADVGVIFLFASQVLDESVLQPVEVMVAGAERVARGEHRYRLEEVGADELRRLAQTVNRMADHLIEQQEELARNVESLHQANRKLRQAQRELVRAEKLASVGRLAAGIAHEVGNPLGSIIGYAEVAQRRHPEVGEWANEIEKEARRIDRIVKSLLQYARPTDEEQRHKLNVQNAIYNAVELLDAQGRLEPVSVNVTVNGDLAGVHAKPSELEQVLVNLLLNAVDVVNEVDVEPGYIGILAERKSEGSRPLPPRDSTPAPRRASDPEGVNFSHLREDDPAVLETERSEVPSVDDESEWVTITVEDNGPGFPEEAPDQVLDPFYTTKEPGKGTGLGLFVSSQIVRHLDGQLEVKNRPSGGGAVTIWLPVHKGEMKGDMSE